MKRKFSPSRARYIVSYVVFVFFGFLSTLTSWALAQSGQRMVLTFRTQGATKVISPYGPAGVSVKAEGYAYLIPGSQGKFTGTGDIYVTMDFDYKKTGTFSISQLKGEGPLEVVGETEGKYLRFYFKHQNIPCKGEIVVNAPAPMGTVKEPYEDNFDPHVVAPGENPGAKIELKDGATSTFSYGPKSFGGGVQIMSWRTDFTLDGAELWRVAIEGEEIDTTQSPIRNKKLQNKSKELPIAMQYEWKLIGEFALIGKGSARQYYEGQVFSANINPVILFDHWDLYRVEKMERSDDWDQEDLAGQPLGGKVSGSTVQLKWPEFDALERYVCIPKKSYLGKVPHRPNFESREFIGYISREKLPLVDGQVVTGGQSDWLKYKITLTKLD
ncbi:MAG: hypothetical protein JSV17_15815 [Candidatus Aminicenantes bacterium]|nr:MAG: hypothetical protein JSV17_15815 [Candidatus Aminicenantes bacterium]